jgi:hypothetical protein
MAGCASNRVGDLRRSTACPHSAVVFYGGVLINGLVAGSFEDL